MYKVIWISTAPRTGSMWTFNVARRLLATVGFKVLPDLVPKSDDDCLQIYDQAMADHYAAHRYCLKVHLLFDGLPPRSKVITTLRDPRDMCLSYMTFMNVGFEAALETVRWAITCHEHYEKMSSDAVHLVRYEDITANPELAIEKICSFMELEVPQEKFRALADELAAKEIAKLVAAKTADLEGRLAAGTAVSADEYVVSPSAKIRAYDTKTGFQTGHVSENEAGAWRRVLSVEQQKVLENVTGDFCRRLGFD